MIRNFVTSPNSFVQKVRSPSKHGFIGLAAVMPDDPLPFNGIGLSLLSTYPLRIGTDGLLVTPVIVFPPGPFGIALVTFLPLAFPPELLLGRDDVDVVTFELDVVRLKPSVIDSSVLGIVRSVASICRATTLITYKLGSINDSVSFFLWAR